MIVSTGQCPYSWRRDIKQRRCGLPKNFENKIEVGIEC